MKCFNKQCRAHDAGWCNAPCHLERGCDQRIEEPEQSASAPVESQSSGSVSRSPGYYWQQDSANKWRILEIVNLGDEIEPYLVVNAVNRNFTGRSLRLWGEHEEIGEWVRIDPPNVGG